MGLGCWWTRLWVGVPEVRVAPAGLEAEVVAFAGLLRASGMGVPVAAVLACVEALAVLGADRREHVYWAGRLTLVRRPEDLSLYDAAFHSFWVEGHRASAEVDDSTEAPANEETAEVAFREVRWSRNEALRDKDFATCSPSELEEANRLMRDIRLAAAMRRSRRWRQSTRSHSGARPDLRRTLRASMRTGGDPVLRVFLDPSTRARRIVLLCDVSGSMEPYVRVLLRFLHVAVAGRRDVEAFTLGTRITRVTRELSSRDTDAALTRASKAVADWTGGTRLGEGIKGFNDDWGVRGMARGAVVVIVSDGWDRGEPSELAEQMARLRRVAWRIVWVNPLKATPGYEPLARGMAAALPYVDEHVEGHSLASLESLASVVAL